MDAGVRNDVMVWCDVGGSARAWEEVPDES
jgi:hypothetical protein